MNLTQNGAADYINIVGGVIIYTILPRIMAQAFILFQQLFTPAGNYTKPMFIT